LLNRCGDSQKQALRQNLSHNLFVLSYPLDLPPLFEKSA